MDNLIVEKFNIDMSGNPPYRSGGGTRGTLAFFMGEMGFKSGAEIGVLRGGYSRDLCNSMPGLCLKCVDPWVSFRRNTQRFMDDCHARTCRRLRGFNAEVIRKPSMEAVKDVVDESLDFVYIDAMHEFDPVMLDLIFWSQKVKKGGIVAGHDYSEPQWWNGVQAVVNTYTDAHNITRWYVTDEIDASFFWVKI